MITPVYWGIFFDDPHQILEGTLEKQIEFPHVTYGFKVPYPEEELQGVLCIVKLIGYGKDDNNEAWLVELPTWTLGYYHGATNPHIAISVSKTGKPVDSGKLEFQSIDPIKIVGRFGYFNGRGIVV